MVMLFLLKRMRPFAVQFLMTGLIVLSSILIVCLLDLLFLGRIDLLDLLIGTITPSILGWLLVGLFLRLLLRLKRTEQELQLLANEDSLTHLLNRRRFLELADQEWARGQRYQRPLTLCILDVDHFKAINDSYSHAAGDLALQHLATILRGELRSHDLVARYGGEEFAILLAETGAAEALPTAERLRATLAASSVRFHDTAISMTVSIGLATSGEHCDKLEDLLVAADQALYLAKARGRNQIVAGTCSAH